MKIRKPISVLLALALCLSMAPVALASTTTATEAAAFEVAAPVGVPTDSWDTNNRLNITERMFTYAGKIIPGSEGVSERFADVEKDDWYYDAVQWAVDNGLMYGVAEEEFAPDDTATRAMVVTMLWRMADTPAAAARPLFTDTKDDAWYADAVAWAVSTGIAHGVNETEFSPDTAVTREQLATIMYRYAQTIGRGFTGAWAFPLNFSDTANVSEYAYEPLCWMTMKGVITGMGNSTLASKENATRAQIAAMFKRFAVDSLSYEEFKALDSERQKQAFDFFPLLFLSPFLFSLPSLRIFYSFIRSFRKNSKIQRHFVFTYSPISFSMGTVALRFYG